MYSTKKKITTKESHVPRLAFVFLAREIETMRLLVACMIFSFSSLFIERRLSTLEATFARNRDINDQFQPVFVRMLALKGASKKVFDEKLRKQSNSLEERLRRYKNTVEHQLRQHREAISGEFKRLKEEIFMGYVDKQAHEMLRGEMRKSNANLGQIAKFVRDRCRYPGGKQFSDPI